MKKNIIILVSKLSNGGAEKAATMLAENLSQKYNVSLVVFDNRIQDYSTNVNLIDLQTPITSNFLKKILNFLKRIRLLRKIKKQYDADCTISFLTGPNLINIMSKTKDKTIISIRNNIKEKGKLENIINNYVIKHADKIVTVSEDMKNYYIKNKSINLNDIITINNVCDREKIYLQAKEDIENYKDLFENGKIIISLGRYVKQKGQWHLIKAFLKLVREDKEYKLVLFGRGKGKKKLQKLINYLKLNKNVFLLDFVKNPYIYLQKSEIFVISSLYEGFSNVILDAMAVGLPIIATDCDYGNREIISSKKNFPKITEYQKEEYGILVPTEDKKYFILKTKLTKEENELYKAMKELINNKALKKYYQQKSLERIHDFEENTAKWIDCIEKD